jgi:exodeoxyribonuclease-1
MPKLSYYFYDLETTSGSPFTGHIMQFAGQRTDENMQPIGEPDNILIRLSDDILPEPDAVLVHGIAPQKTLEEGLSEVEFLRYFHESIATVGTVFIGYNSLRFDDEFTRRINYRNFYDPYQWHWKDGRSRWDLLDPIRMMRALRPEGMKWPMLDKKPSVKLELMARENGIAHENAHDALSDVLALISLADMFKKAQPKLFEYLVGMRDKKKVAKLALEGNPFVYTSGKYSADYDKTTVVSTLFKHPRRDGVVVYDLRHDPTEWIDKSVDELVKHWTVKYGEDTKRLPVKTMQFNKCPAIAPFGVLDEKTQERLGLVMDDIHKNTALLHANGDFIARLEKALDIIDGKQQAEFDLEDKDVENQMYDSFWSPTDQLELASIRTASPDQLSGLITEIKSKRIRELLPRYKARNFPKLLTTEEREDWEIYRQKFFYSGGSNSRYAKFSKRMQEIATTRKLSKNDEYLLTELQLYAESILPEPID